MRYSVLIPAFNASDTIRECLTSVVGQTLSPDEIIVVDDGSTDNTADIAGRFDQRIKVYRQDNLGPGAATTAAIAQASQPLVAMLDADDLWQPEKMARQIDHLRAHPECHAVFAHMR